MYAAPKANGGSGNGKSHRYSMYAIVYSIFPNRNQLWSDSSLNVQIRLLNYVELIESFAE